MPDFRSVRRRLEAKSVVMSPSWIDSGQGRQPWPAMAQRDFPRVAGRLDEHSTIGIALRWIRLNIIQGRLTCGTESGGDYDEWGEPDADPVDVEAGAAPASRTLHPLIQRLRRPNPWDSWRATLGGTSDSLCVDGNAYWIKARSLIGDVEYTWAPNHMIAVEEEDVPAAASVNGPIRGYWLTSLGRRKWYTPADVIHFRNGRDPYRRCMGLADLKRQIRNAAGVSAAERYTAAVLINAHAGKVISPKDVVGGIVTGSPEESEMEALARSMERGLSEENAGRYTKTSLPVDILDGGLGPESMMLDRIVDRPESYILAALGLNALVLGLPSSKDVATYANKGEARREAWENGVIPVQDLIADELEVQALPDFADVTPAADSVWWDRRDVHALKEDADARATRSVALRGAGIATQNESRQMVDLPPQEGGDATAIDEQQQAQEQALQMAAAQPDPAANTPPETKTLDEDDDDSLDDGHEIKIKRAKLAGGHWVTTEEGHHLYIRGDKVVAGRAAAGHAHAAAGGRPSLKEQAAAHRQTKVAAAAAHFGQKPESMTPEKARQTRAQHLAVRAQKAQKKHRAAQQRAAKAGNHEKAAAHHARYDANFRRSEKLAVRSGIRQWKDGGANA